MGGMGKKHIKRVSCEERDGGGESLGGQKLVQFN